MKKNHKRLLYPLHGRNHFHYMEDIYEFEHE